MSSPPPPDDATSPPLAGRARGIVAVAAVIVVGAATGTLPFVVPLVALWVMIRWARVAGGVTVGRILLASEVQMAPALEALGFTLAEEGQGPSVPDDAVAEVVPGGDRRVRRRFVPRADLRPVEIATVEVVGGFGGLRRRAVITVGHELADPDDAAAAAALLQASTLVPGSDVPETARFGCAGGWVARPSIRCGPATPALRPGRSRRRSAASSRTPATADTSHR